MSDATTTERTRRLVITSSLWIMSSEPRWTNLISIWPRRNWFSARGRARGLPRQGKVVLDPLAPRSGRGGRRVAARQQPAGVGTGELEHVEARIDVGADALQRRRASSGARRTSSADWRRSRYTARKTSSTTLTGSTSSRRAP